MPAVVAIVLGLLAISFYIYLCGLLFVYFTFPVGLIGLGIGFAAGVAIGLFAVFMVLFGAPNDRVFTPGDVAVGKLKILRTPSKIRPDQAWPGYFVVQVWQDWRVMADQAAGWLGPVFAWCRTQALRSGVVGLACWPFLLPVPVALAGLVLGVVILLVLAALALTGTAVVIWPIGVVTAIALRVLDRAGRSVRRSAANCPRCYQVSSLPVYRCAGPHPDRESALHHDIRPGLLGVLYRRCGCGRRLPTTVLRAAHSMAALCPLCHADLHAGAGAATDVRIPVFGAPSSGKTHLITAAVVAFLRRGGDVQVTLADEHSERTYQTFASVVDGGGSTAKTDAAHQPIAIVLRLQQGRREALLHVYDAAGEALANPEMNERFQYLDAARTLIFVLDPFAVPDVRQHYQRSFPRLFDAADVSAELPEPSYQGVVTRLRQYGVRTEKKRLAFVVSKRDLVQQLPNTSALTGDSDAIRDWLIKRGEDNLVASAERDFGTVRYFSVAATDRTADGPMRPFEWLLEDEPTPRPAPLQAIRTDRPVRPDARR